MLHLSIENYKSIIFDCDGVILDSNKLKTHAFYQTALSYGKEAAQALVNHHIENGGISRYRKFEYFLNNILDGAREGVCLESLLSVYAEQVSQGLLNCTIAPGLFELRRALPQARWFVVSGADQTELREVFKVRGINHLFDGGIFGSPDSKDEILSKEKEENNILMPSLFLGDSRYDYSAAKNADMDFAFIAGWSEMSEWQEFCENWKIQSVHSVEDLLSQMSSSVVRS